MTGVRIERVVKRFAIAGERVTALDAVSLAVEPGSMAALIGPSGCGKSTLLRLVADILAPDQGRITIDGAPPRAARLAHKLGFVFQDATLLPWRSVLANVALPLEIIGAARAGAQRAEALLELVGLKGFERARPAQLSGGMQQRVAIARALVLEPEVLLLDEPFGALDEITRQKMNLELLRIWRESRTTAILVTHSLAEAVFMADVVHVLAARPGRLVASIPVDLPRPRELVMLADPRFTALTNRVREALFGEQLADAA